jgi:pentapeptide MXKDX repeat protein
MFYSFSDGGCSNNGKKNAIASYCSMLIDGKTRQIIKGLVLPHKYNINFDNFLLIEDNNTLYPFISIDKSMHISPSNNRGELLGIIYCLAQLYIISTKDTITKDTITKDTITKDTIIEDTITKDTITKDTIIKDTITKDTIIELYSDSLICVNTLNIWLPNRRLANTAHEMKNYDLICIAEQLLSKISTKYKSIKLIHTKSHQKKPSGENKKKLFIWMGNEFVDKECSSLLH